MGILPPTKPNSMDSKPEPRSPNGRVCRRYETDRSHRRTVSTDPSLAGIFPIKTEEYNGRRGRRSGRLFRTQPPVYSVFPLGLVGLNNSTILPRRRRHGPWRSGALRDLPRPRNTPFTYLLYHHDGTSKHRLCLSLRNAIR